MTTYVLIGGAWLGGWCWQPVARRLRAGGHDVYPMTLTGLGERKHLSGPRVNLDTHIEDVMNLLEYEDLHDVVLVGHSYAGIVITGVADRAAERNRQVVYLDTGPVSDGMAFLDIQSPEARQQAERAVAEQGDGWRLPMPSWEELAQGNSAILTGLGEEQRALMRARAVDQPFGTYTQPLRLTNPARAALPKVLVTCSLPLEQVRAMIAGGHPWFRDLAGPEWSFVELPTGHWPMFSVPDQLATALDGLSAPAPAGSG